MPRSAGRSGRPWRRLVAQVKARDSHCWLCHGQLDHSLPTQDLWSTTVHHIVPLARGGAPLDPSNVAGTHKLCNLRFGDGGTRYARRRRSSGAREALGASRDW